MKHKILSAFECLRDYPHLDSIDTSFEEVMENISEITYNRDLFDFLYQKKLFVNTHTFKDGSSSFFAGYIREGRNMLFLIKTDLPYKNSFYRIILVTNIGIYEQRSFFLEYCQKPPHESIVKYYISLAMRRETKGYYLKDNSTNEMNIFRMELLNTCNAFIEAILKKQSEIADKGQESQLNSLKPQIDNLQSIIIELCCNDDRFEGKLENVYEKMFPHTSEMLHFMSI